jgi:tetratricopeptide (TPR) repeat protein
MSPKIVFLSYSHDSEEHRVWVLGLSERLRADGIETCLDQYEEGTPTETWPRWMLDRLDEADSVLLICTATYYRRFRGHEEPGKGKGVDWEGAIITQGIYDARSRTKKFVPVLRDAENECFIPEPIRGHTHYTLTTEAGYQALLEALLGVSGVEPRPVGPVREKERRKGTPLVFAGGAGSAEPKIAPTRLPQSAPKLFGRAAELAKLDAAWADSKIHVVTLVAFGGVGKTSLVGEWAARLAARDYDGASYFDWSFYSQGTREQGAATGEPFVAAALPFFGGEEGEALATSPTSAWDKGAKLADLVAKRRTLLILDGLEPLQYPPSSPLAGQLKDPGLEALLKGLAQRNSGLCVVTTRERVANLEGFRESTAPEGWLERLATVDGVELLKSFGVWGSKTDLEGLVEEVEGHALTLNLLGRYLYEAHGGDVRKKDLVKLEEADLEERGGHAFRAIAAYENWLGGEKEAGARQLAVLRLLGLFDRPADRGCIRALREEPAIPGLTKPLVGILDAQWNTAVSKLAGRGLVVRSAQDALDAHPLVREYFARQLRKKNPEAWRAAHGRLFEHLRDSTEKFPDTLEGLQPLYQAVAHGCLAGRYEEARAEIYRDRILRGGEFYSTKMLGAFGTDLGAVACFFDPPWSRVSPSLSEADQAWLLNQAAFRLRALGRLTEAVEAMRAALEMAVAQETWKHAAVGASNLSELELTLGHVSGAVEDAERSVTFADQSGDAFERISDRTAHADALHQSGRREEALARFVEAERMQAEVQPEYPRLYSLQGFQYCDLLLGETEQAAGRGEELSVGAPAGSRLGEVDERAEGALRAWREIFTNASILDLALDHLTLGRVALYRSVLEGMAPATARSEIEQAMDGLRRAGINDYLVRGLLTRAWLLFLEGDEAGARASLAEAEEIAARGPMPLVLADVAIYRGRMFKDRAALVEARRLIEKHGYGRRLGELEDAERMANGKSGS